MSAESSGTAKRDSATLDLKSGKSVEITTQIATTPLEEKMKIDEMDIDGVFRFTMSTETQQFIGFVIERKIVPDVSWTYVSKEAIEHHINTYGKKSDFFKAQEQVKKFPGTEFFIGCSASIETENQFYLCVTAQAEKNAQEILKRKKSQLDKEFENTLNKSPKLWVPFGSEKDVDDSIVKNSRPLVEKEITVSLVEKQGDLNFHDVDPKTLPFGYVEFCKRSDIISIRRKRYSQGIQACPSVESTTAQTNPGFPTNMWTQYEYEPQISSEALNKQLDQNINAYKDHVEIIQKMINYNQKIDLYENDYPHLVVNELDTLLPDCITYEEYETFINIENCHEKKISCAEWHPTLPGVMAIAYVKKPNFLYQYYDALDIDESATDDVMEALYENNVVLIWSTVERFKPKLILESPRTVHCLQFSPLDGHKLAGGLMNGQVVIWDLSEKYEKIQETSLQIEEKSKNSLCMGAHLSWMKKKRSPDIFVTPSAITLLNISHETCVTGIQWLSPFWRINEMGNYEKLKGNAKSEEFMSCASDGCIKVWNLKNKKLSETSAQRKKSHPTSPHPTEVLPMGIPTFISHFKVYTHTESTESDKDAEILPLGIPLYCMATDYMYQSYKKERRQIKSIKQISTLTLKSSSDQVVNPLLVPKKILKVVKEDDEYNAVPKKSNIDPKPEITVGTMDGVVTKLSWNDVDSDTEQTAGPRVASFIFWNSVHDGPVISLFRSPFIYDLLLSVGGKIFAIWKESAKEVLLYRKKFPVLLTSGCWSPHRPSVFYISRVDGKMEVWDLFEQSDKASFFQDLSGEMLTGVYPHVLPLLPNIVGVADAKSQFRMLCIPSQHFETTAEEIDKLHTLINREIIRKESFITWQNIWEVKNCELLKKRKEMAEMEARRAEEAERERARILREQKRKKQQELEARQLRIAEIRAKTFTWKQDAEEKWGKAQEDYLIRSRLLQKSFDKKKLLIEQKPYTAIVEGEKSKKKKIRQKLKEKNSIYESTINFLFPEMTEMFSSAAVSPNEVIEQCDVIIADGKSYEDVEQEALNYIKNHPFEISFDWTEFMKEAHEREVMLQERVKQMHFTLN